MALKMGIERLKVFGDSLLILSQIDGLFKIRKPELVKYHEKALELMAKFTSISLEKVPRSLNGKADALARLANELSDPSQEEIQILVHRRRALSPCFQQTKKEEEEETMFVDIFNLEKQMEEEWGETVQVMVTDGIDQEDWRQPFLDYFQQGKLPDNIYIREQIRKRALRYGNPRKIISDNGTAFKNAKIAEFVEKHKIEWTYSSIYNPRANGLAEAFNKVLIKILRKTVGVNHRNWHEKLPEALWAYRITYRTPTQATAYSLVYGTEAVLPIEVELPFLRVAMASEIPLTKQMQLRLQELDGMDKRRLAAQQNLELYQARIIKAYEKLSRARAFRKGELVLVLRRPITGRHHGPKFAPNWEGPYIIDQVYDGGAYLLANQEEKPYLPHKWEIPEKVLRPKLSWQPL
ncbi:hypothetical protein LUZ63_012744 [Rhynchospora breviuscula]|uniref:Integrase catalytic domain-containing protein n=1 Tax=Rhynchospora breviuscula TaxID=2022672 RepID=A0A9Q0HJX2_9POAL|nr:hypothetical protein LUZ63_016191 [Rhynchospora breviuscula]KAJ1688589.1 hypothetical protein LUZ63_012744 [Rhynchospora breviuscula]